MAAEDFGSTTPKFAGVSGAWTVIGGCYTGTPGTDAALSTMGLVVEASLVVLQATVNTRAMAGHPHLVLLRLSLKLSWPKLRRKSKPGCSTN